MMHADEFAVKSDVASDNSKQRGLEKGLLGGLIERLALHRQCV